MMPSCGAVAADTGTAKLASDIVADIVAARTARIFSIGWTGLAFLLLQLFLVFHFIYCNYQIYGRSGLSSAACTANAVTTATTPIAYHTNLLEPAVAGGPPCEDLPPAEGAAAASAGVGSRMTRNAIPSGMTRVSPAIVNASAPRALFTINSRGPRTETCPTVGSSVFGRIAASAKCSVNALALAVENVAVPEVNVAPGSAKSVDSVATPPLASKNRAAPSRICTLPEGSVLSSSPPNTVLPTEAAAKPTRA